MTAQKRGGSAKAKPRGRPFTGKDDPRHNAGGRRKIPEDVKAILKAGTVPAAQALVDIVATSDDEHARIKAAGIILDRVLGKAPAAVEDRDAMKEAAVGLVVGIRDMAKLTDEDMKHLEDIAARARPDSQP